MKGNPIHKDIQPYIAQPLRVTSNLEKLGDWHQLRIDVSSIQKLNIKSSIY